MRAHVTVIIPARNEEDSIGKVLKAIPPAEVDHVIVCDNGSQDRTATIARQHGAEVAYEPHAGYGAACLCALEKLPPSTDIVAFLDADFSDDPSEISKLLKPIRDGEYDLVLGSRVAAALPGALTPQQRFGNWLATRLLAIIYRKTFTDLGPFRAITRKALHKIEMKDRGMGWTIEMQLKALRHKMRILEVPVSYRPRIGESKISGTIRGSVRAGCKILYLIGREFLRGKPRPKTPDDS